jgi:hypothetical protein
MKSAAWALMMLGLTLLAPTRARAQECSPKEKVGLCRNYPNPFNPETFIPFRVDAELFANGQKPVVTVRIYNVLAQLVAVPILQGSGEKLDQHALAFNGTGSFTAYWDGKYQGTEREAASGVYLYQLTIQWMENGKPKSQSFSKKMTVAK